MNPTTRSLIAFLIVGTAGGCAWLGRYTRPPRVTLEKVSIAKVTFQDVKLQAHLKIENRYPVEVPVPKIGYAIAVDGKDLVDGELKKKVTLPSSASSSPFVKVKVPMNFTFEKLYRLSATYKNKREAPYKLKGFVHIDTPVGPVEVPFEHRGKVPVLKPPQVDMPEVVVSNMGFSGADLRLKFRIRNPNTIGLSVTKLDYGLDVTDIRIAQGSLPNAVSLPSRGTTTADMDVHVGLAELGAAAQTVLKRSNVDYGLTGTLSVGTPWGTVSTPLNAKGTAKLSR